MGQMLAVFRKDVRREWPQLAGAVTLTVLAGLADRPGASAGYIANLMYLLCLVYWMCLGASVIQQEYLPGDRQYWLTRPYDWRWLLAAKLLFAFAFAALPLIVTKSAVLWANGVSPLRHAPAVLSISLGLAGAVGLLTGALAAVTRTLTQFLWGLLALVALEAAAIAAGVNYGGDWGALAWLRSVAVAAPVAAVSLAVLLLQYRRRRTRLSCTILSVAALLTAAVPFGNTWHNAWRLGNRLGPAVQPAPRPVTIAFDTTPRPRVRYADAPLFPGYGREGLYLPLRVSGIPSGSGVVSERAAVTLEGSRGQRWSSGWLPEGVLIGADPLTDVRFIQADGLAWQYLDVDRAFYQAVKDTPARIHVSIALTLLSDARSGAVQGYSRTGRVPLDGICEARPIQTFSKDLRGARGARNVGVSCAWPQPGPERAYVRASSPSQPEHSHALMASEAMSLFSVNQPVWRHEVATLAVRGADLQFIVETWRASGRLERSFDISGLRLKDYVAPRATGPQ
jgi:hypothetical protein